MSETSDKGDSAATSDASSPGKQGTKPDQGSDARLRSGDGTPDTPNFLNAQKDKGAEGISSFARATRDAASRFDRESPTAARYVRQAADGIDQVSKALRQTSIDQLAQDIAAFARRQPIAFFGATVFVGLALSRVLKSAGAGLAAPEPMSPRDAAHTTASESSGESHGPYGF